MENYPNLKTKIDIKKELTPKYFLSTKLIQKSVNSQLTIKLKLSKAQFKTKKALLFYMTTLSVKSLYFKKIGNVNTCTENLVTGEKHFQITY